jgi:NADPH:quinone reductase-like Zn-dependent oxidoreductase
MASGAILVVYSRLSSEATPVPRPCDLERLAIRGFGLPSIVADDAKLAALEQFIGEGLAAGALRPAIAKVFLFGEIVVAHRYLEAGEQVGKVIVAV